MSSLIHLDSRTKKGFHFKSSNLLAPEKTNHIYENPLLHQKSLSNKFIFGCKKADPSWRNANKNPNEDANKKEMERCHGFPKATGFFVTARKVWVQRKLGLSFEIRQGPKLCGRMAVSGDNAQSRASPSVRMGRSSDVEQNGRPEPRDRCNKVAWHDANL